MTAYDFPTSPSNGELYPTNPTAEQIQYIWNSTDSVWNINSDGYYVTQNPITPQARLTLTTGTPVLAANSLNTSSTLYYTPYNGNQLTLYNTSTSKWERFTLSEISLLLTGLTDDLPYDVFLYNNSGTLTLEILAWTDYKTRATALTRQNGMLVKSGDASRLYLGCFFAISNVVTLDFRATFLDNPAKLMGLVNAHHRVIGTGVNLSINTLSIGTGVSALNDGYLRSIYDEELGNFTQLSTNAQGRGDSINWVTSVLRESTFGGADTSTVIAALGTMRPDHYVALTNTGSRQRHGLLIFRQVVNTGAGTMLEGYGRMTYTVEY